MSANSFLPLPTTLFLPTTKHCHMTQEVDKKSAVGTPSGSPNGITVELEIMPGKTEEFIEGDAGTYRISFNADGI
eukprot:gene6330-4557_t